MSKNDDNKPLNPATTTVAVTVDKKPVTITAKNQTVTQGGSIKQSVGQVTVTGLVSGHKLSAVTLNSGSTGSATTKGTITPSAAKIVDGGNNDVTANYKISYNNGTLTVKSSTPTPAPAPTPAPTIDLRFTTNPVTLSVEQAKYAKKYLQEPADYVCSYKDADGQGISLTPTFTLEGSYPDWLELSNSLIRANPTEWEDAEPGETVTATLRATASYGGVTKSATVPLVVTVTGYTELEVTAPDAALTVYPGSPESQLNLNPLITVKGKHSVRGWETVDINFSMIGKVGSWPSWLSFGPSKGVVAKAPAGTAPGRYEYEYAVTVGSSGNLEATGKGKLIVIVSEKSQPEPAKIAMNTDTLPDATEGGAYSAMIYATGDSPIHWVVEDPTMPDGLTLNEDTGEISGTPTATDAGKRRRFRVYVSNPANADKPDKKEFFITVWGQTPAGWDVKKSSLKVTKGGTFDVTFKVKEGRGVSYSTVEKPDSTYVTKVTTHYSDEAGGGYIRYTCVWPEKKQTSYKFKVRAKNKFGAATKTMTVRVSSAGKVASLGGAADYGVILAEEEEPDSETFEKYPEPKADDTPDESGVTYFHNGYEDEDGNITAVIGTPVEGEDGAEYVYDTLDAMLSAANLKDRLGSVTRLEIRKDATVTTDKLNVLSGLTELAIDNCSLGNLNLSGWTKLKRVSLYGCGELMELDVSDCSSLTGLNADSCPKLETLNVEGCSALEGVSVMNAAITTLDLSNRASLASVNVTGCAALETLDVSGCPSLTALDANAAGLASLNVRGDPSLAEVSLNSVDVAALDLSDCSALKSLSLTNVPKLAELTLPSGAAMEELTLTKSRVKELDLSGNMSLTSLDLNGGASLISLDVSGCSGLKSMNVSECGALSALDAGGCSALEKLTATGCASLTSLAIDGGGTLRELNVGGAKFLASLEAGGQALGRLDLDGLNMLTFVDCSEQFISGVPMSRTLNLKDYVGNGLSRVSDVQGYAADGSEIALTSWNVETGVATFASVPATASYLYDTGLYDNLMDVTLSLNGKAADQEGSGSTTGNRSASGGCDGTGAGLVGLVLLAFTALAFLKSLPRS